MKYPEGESLSFDPVHGYIPFVSTAREPGEVTERQIMDHPWVQRLRQIHQLQTAWLVFPSAEHTRFQHVLGVMHLASRAVARLYESLREVCPDTPSRGYVESLMRMAGLLHDVGHGPFGHFLDSYYLSRFGQTHETVGRVIIEEQLGSLLRGVRRSPDSSLEAGEQLDPAQISALISRPRAGAADDHPRWLQLLRSLFCGIYTVDNLDFVLRDAYTSGYNTRAVDLDRLLRYSFFSEQGLTIHSRGLDALLRFIAVRGELFRTIYFHRTVRGIDLALRDLFIDSSDLLFPGNPLDHLDEYLHFTEWSLLVDVGRWSTSGDARKRELGPRWQAFLAREIPWRMAVQRSVSFSGDSAEAASIFSRGNFVEQAIREKLPEAIRGEPLAVDLARHMNRPGARGAAANQNFYYDQSQDLVRPLTDDQLFRNLPISQQLVRVYMKDLTHRAAVAAALDSLLGTEVTDDLTNM